MVEEAQLQIVFYSSEAEDNLQKIELFRVPGEQSLEGKYVVSKKMQGFCEHFIAQEIFQANRQLSQYSFESVKIWLHNVNTASVDTASVDTEDAHTRSTDTVCKLQKGDLPNASETVMTLRSHIEDSGLKCIFILDSGLSGQPGVLWREGCRELLLPLFHRFVAPTDPPDILKEFLVMRLGQKLTDRLDLYFSMQKNMCFNALIVAAR